MPPKDFDMIANKNNQFDKTKFENNEFLDTPFVTKQKRQINYKLILSNEGLIEWSAFINQAIESLNPSDTLVINLDDFKQAFKNNQDEVILSISECLHYALKAGFCFSGITAYGSLQLTKKKQRILYVAPWITYGGSDKGTIDWFWNMDPALTDLYLITTQSSDNSQLYRVQNRAKEIWNLPSIINGSDMPRFILDFIYTRKIDTVHIMNSRLAFDMLPVIKKYFNNIQTVVQLHVEEDDCSGYCRYVTTRYESLIDSYSVISNNLKVALLKYRVSPSKIEVIYLGVDAEDEFNPDKIQYSAEFAIQHKIDSSRMNVLFPGRLEEQKDPLLMLEVAKSLKLSDSKALFHVVGDGSLSNKLEKEIDQLGLGDTVLLHGASRQMPLWYKHTDMTLLTSRFEGLALVIYEAMAMKQTPVVSDVGANKELIVPGTGFLIKNRTDVEEYKKCILQLEKSESLRNITGINARNYVKTNFTTVRMGQQHLELYNKIHLKNLLRQITRGNFVNGTSSN